MTIKHIYEVVEKAMNVISDIDFINLDKKRENQKKVNDAYKILDDFKDEIIRENIIKKQEIYYKKINKEQNKTISDSWDEISK